MKPMLFQIRPLRRDLCVIISFKVDKVMINPSLEF